MQPGAVYATSFGEIGGTKVKGAPIEDDYSALVVNLPQSSAKTGAISIREQVAMEIHITQNDGSGLGYDKLIIH